MYRVFRSAFAYSEPYIDDLILNTISLDYHETLMAAAGHVTEAALDQAVSNPEGYICVIEGACMINVPVESILKIESSHLPLIPKMRPTVGVCMNWDAKDRTASDQWISSPQRRHRLCSICNWSSMRPEKYCIISLKDVVLL